MVEYLLVHDPSAVKEIADRFVSHAWSYNLADLVDGTATLNQSSKEEVPPPPPKLFLWMDIFVVNQHRAAAKEYPNDFWGKAFHEAIAKIGHTVAILYP